MICNDKCISGVWCQYDKYITRIWHKHNLYITKLMILCTPTIVIWKMCNIQSIFYGQESGRNLLAVSLDTDCKISLATPSASISWFTIPTAAGRFGTMFGPDGVCMWCCDPLSAFIQKKSNDPMPNSRCEDSLGIRMLFGGVGLGKVLVPQAFLCAVSGRRTNKI